MSEQITLLQSTDYVLRELTVITEFGNFDLSQVFEELNIFDNIFLPCMTGHVLLRDSVGMFKYLKFDGNEYLKINIDKTKNKDEAPELSFEKLFRIFSPRNRIHTSSTSQLYILDFISPQYFVSEQKRLTRYYDSQLYSSIIKSVMKDELKLEEGEPKNGISTINKVINSSAMHDIHIPNLTLFQTIEWLTKRCIYGKTGRPEFVFYETKQGYNLVPLTYLYNPSPSDYRVYQINFSPKNVDDDVLEEFLGVRDYKILSQSSVNDSMQDGAYAGKFIAFDTLTKTKIIYDFDFDSFNKPEYFLNKDGIPNIPTKNLKTAFNTRVVTYPFALPRSNTSYIKTKDPKLSTILNDTENYMYHRRALISNLMQKRMELVLPGNFNIFSGKILYLKVPYFSIKTEEIAYEDDGLDLSLSGNYIILGTRHVIRSDKHETIVEVASDSSIYTGKRKEIPEEQQI